MWKFPIVKLKWQQLSPFVDSHYSAFNRTDVWLNTNSIYRIYICLYYQTNYKQKLNVLNVRVSFNGLLFILLILGIYFLFKSIKDIQYFYFNRNCQMIWLFKSLDFSSITCKIVLGRAIWEYKLHSRAFRNLDPP